MIDKKEADAYQEAWLEAERAAIISKFQYSYPWANRAEFNLFHFRLMMWEQAQ